MVRGLRLASRSRLSSRCPFMVPSDPSHTPCAPGSAPFLCLALLHPAPGSRVSGADRPRPRPLERAREGRPGSPSKAYLFFVSGEARGRYLGIKGQELDIGRSQGLRMRRKISTSYCRSASHCRPVSLNFLWKWQ